MDLFLIAAVILTVIGEGLVTAGALRATSDPSPITWSIWFVLDAAMFTAMWQANGGFIGEMMLPGIYTVAVLIVSCGAFWAWAKVRNAQKLSRWEFGAIAGGSVGLVAWKFTGDPVLGVVILAATAVTAGIPELKTAWEKPHRTSLVSWVLLSAGAWANMPGTELALKNAFPLAVVGFTTTMVLTTLARRRVLDPAPAV